MPGRARLYIACVAMVGLAVLAMALLQGAFPNPVRFLMLSLLALLASTLKIPLPGFTGNISVSFLFILIGVTDFSFTETVTMACAAALVQSLWKPRRRPQPVQVLFNVTSLAISVAIAFGGSHPIVAKIEPKTLPVVLAVAASLFFLCNTGLVAGVISLVEQRSFRETWGSCNIWSFPYYLVGVTIAGLITVLNRSLGWKLPLLVLSLMYLAYVWYRQYIENRVRQITRAKNGVIPAMAESATP